MTIKHFYYFGPTLKTGEHVHSASAWDDLYMQSASDQFAMPGDRDAWLKRAEREPFIKERARDIADIVRGRFTRINSYATGHGFLEYYLKTECPELIIQCSDYTVKAMQCLRQVFTEADEVMTFDMLLGQWNHPERSALHLFYRTDTVLDDDQAKAIFARMHAAGVQNVLFFPWELLIPRRYITQLIKRWVWPLIGCKMTFAGYIRTKSQFPKLFGAHYNVEREVHIAGDLTGFLLTIK